MRVCACACGVHGCGGRGCTLVRIWWGNPAPRAVSCSDDLAPSPPSVPGPRVSPLHLPRNVGAAVPGAAGEEQGLWPHAARGLTPCVPGRHPPLAPHPRHLSLGPQRRVSAAVGASHLAWLASGEGRRPLRGHAGRQAVRGATVGWAAWPRILLGLQRPHSSWPSGAISSLWPSRSQPFLSLPSFSPQEPSEAIPHHLPYRVPLTLISWT